MSVSVKAPSRVALLRSITLVGIMLVPLGTVAFLWGAATAMVVTQAVLVVATSAPSVSTRWAMVFIGVTAVLATGADLFSGNSAGTLILVAVACVLYGATNRVHEGSLLLTPLIVDLVAGLQLEVNSLVLGFLILAVGAYTLMVLRVLRVGMPAHPVPIGTAVVHTVLITITVTAASGLWIAGVLPHGYWLPLTLLVVLRAAPGLTRRRIRQRTVGTVVGLAAGFLLVVTLPGAALAALVPIFGIVLVAYQLDGNYAHSVVFISLVVILGGHGEVHEEVFVILERLLLTLAGITIAIGVLPLLPKEPSDPAPDLRQA